MRLFFFLLGKMGRFPIRLEIDLYLVNYKQVNLMQFHTAHTHTHTLTHNLPDAKIVMMSRDGNHLRPLPNLSNIPTHIHLTD